MWRLETDVLFFMEGGDAMKEQKTGFVERIGGTIFIVNAMSAGGAKQTQEELVKSLIARDSKDLEADAA